MIIKKLMDKYLVETRDVEKVWEVTRRWYVYADRSTDAIMKTKNWKHDKSSVKLLKKIPAGVVPIGSG